MVKIVNLCVFYHNKKAKNIIIKNLHVIRPGFKTCVWHNSYNHVKIDICFTPNSRLVATTIRKLYGLLCSMDFTPISLYKICGVRRFGCCHTFQSYQKQHSSLCLVQNTWETCSPLPEYSIRNSVNFEAQNFA